MLCINETGMELIKRKEGLSLKAYPDMGSPLGQACRKEHISHLDYEKLTGWAGLDGAPWTIGYGDTTRVRPGMTCTEDEALKLLYKKVAQFVEEAEVICRRIKFSPNENELAAMVCFTYNLGADDLLQLARKSRLTDAEPYGRNRFAQGMLQYCHQDGEYVKGLYNRRKEEAALFTKIPLIVSNEIAAND